MMSLKRRITLLITLAAAAVIAVTSVATYWKARTIYLGQLDRMLQIMSNGILSDLDGTKSPEELRATAKLVTKSPWKGTGTHFRIWAEGQNTDLASSAAQGEKKTDFLWKLPTEEKPGADTMELFDLNEQKKTYRAVWIRHTTPQGDINVLIAHPSSFEQRRLNELLMIIGLIGGGMLLVVILLAPVIARVAITPIAETAAKLSSVTHQNLGQEDLAAVRTPPELAPFVKETAQLLARLDKGIQRQKQFTSDASHELRTPLSLAQSSLELAQSKPRTPEEYQRAIEEALSDLRRMEGVIQQLLTLSRMDEQGKPQNVAKVQLDGMLLDLTHAFDAKAAQSGGKVVLETAPAAAVSGDPSLLQQLFGNLIDNALAYGPSGGTIRVALSRESNAAGIVSVHDDGGNIPADALPRLFDRFFRAEPSRSRNSGGAGLGLSIAREIALRHGGDIWAESTPESGTTFSVRLPLV